MPAMGKLNRFCCTLLVRVQFYGIAAGLYTAYFVPASVPYLSQQSLSEYRVGLDKHGSWVDSANKGSVLARLLVKG